MESCAKELAARLLAIVVKRTPVGDYSKEITIVAKRNSKKHKKGETYKKRGIPKLGIQCHTDCFNNGRYHFIHSPSNFLILPSNALEGDAVMGTRMHYEVLDGVLHFFVDYDMFVDRREGEIPAMGEVSQETLVKG